MNKSVSVIFCLTEESSCYTRYTSKTTGDCTEENTGR